MKPPRSRWLMLLSSILAPVALLAAASPNVPPGERSTAIFDRDPDHLWNRLFTAFYEQQLRYRIIKRDFAGNNGYYLPITNQPVQVVMEGPDVLDPPIGLTPHFLLVDASFRKCDAFLEEFLKNGGEQMIHDPLKRALLQRDLWSVFDVLYETKFPPTNHTDRNFIVGDVAPDYERPYTETQKQRTDVLMRKVARALARLLLSHEEIAALPNTYREAVSRGTFPRQLSTNSQDYLPADLLANPGPWREVIPASRRIPDGGQFRHTTMVDDRSSFRLFLRLPDKNPGRMPRSTHLPRGAQVLLLREMLCLDENGDPAPTHIVESIQLRATLPSKSNDSLLFREFEMRRALLFEDVNGGLQPILRGEPRFMGYTALGRLVVSDNNRTRPKQPFPENCMNCHDNPSKGKGEFSMLTSLKESMLMTPDSNSMGERTARRKRTRPEFTYLRALMLAP